MESLEFIPGLTAIRQDKDRNVITHTRLETPQIYPDTHAMSVKLSCFYTHTFIKREQMERVTSLLTSERMQSQGLRQLLLSGVWGQLTSGGQGPAFLQTADSQNEASRHLLKPYSIAHTSYFFTPFLPYFYSFYSVLSPP